MKKITNKSYNLDKCIKMCIFFFFFSFSDLYVISISINIFPFYIRANVFLYLFNCQSLAEQNHHCVIVSGNSLVSNFSYESLLQRGTASVTKPAPTMALPIQPKHVFAIQKKAAFTVLKQIQLSLITQTFIGPSVPPLMK